MIYNLVIFLLAFSQYNKKIRALQSKRKKKISLYAILKNSKKIPIAIPKCDVYIC